MNDHEHELLSRHLDGELRGTDRDAAMALLDESAEAREMLASLQEMSALAQEAFPRTRFHYTPAAPARRPAMRRMAALAAAILVIAAGGLVYAAVEQGWFGWGTDSSSQTPSQDGLKLSRGAVSGELPETGQERSAQILQDATATFGTRVHGSSPLPGHIQTLDGTPIEGALVYAVTHSQRQVDKEREAEAYATANSGPDGRFEIDCSPLCDGILVQKTGFVPEWVPYVARVHKASVSIEVYLKRGVPITGRVVTEAGAPIIGAVIQSEPYMWLEHLVSFAKTDSSGVFTVAAINQATIWASHPDYAWACNRFYADEVGTAVMKPGARVRVRVVKRDAPVENALVIVRSATALLPSLMRQRTGPDGTTSFSSLLPGLDYAVSALTDDGEFSDEPAGSTYARAEQVAECVLTLPSDPAITLSGTVYGPDGMPFSDATVAARRQGNINREVAVRSDGTYSISLEEGEYAVSAYAPPGFGLSLHGDSVIARASRTIDFTMESCAMQRIAMRDGSGNPVNTVHVYDRLNSFPRLVLQSSDGTFEIVGHVGDFRLVDPASGMFATLGQSQIGRGQTIEVVLDIPACAIAGRVVDSAGQPLENVRVIAEPQSCTGSTGEFRLYPLSPDFRCTVFGFSLPGHQIVSSVPAALVAGAPPVEIVMAPKTAVLSGHVSFNDGLPASEVGITIEQGESLVDRCTTDIAGAFRAKVSTGGKYRITALAQGIRDYVKFELTGITAPNEKIQIVLPEPSPEVFAEREQPHGLEYVAASEALKSMGVVFKGYAQEAEDEQFPKLDKRFGVLLPDIPSLYPKYIADKAFLNQLAGKQRPKFVYFGYAVNNENAANVFLDAYEQYGPEDLPDDYLNSEAPSPSEVVQRLREGVERFYIKDINDPNDSATVQARIPVLWELPGSHEEAGGYVLYLDGHVEWLPYPGPFPMTETLVSRIQGITAQAQK